MALIDAGAYTPPYDHRLAAALAARGHEVTLLTAPFRFGEAPEPAGYRREELFFPLGSAFPGVPKVTEHPAVVAAATALGATPAQVGLAWLLAHAPEVLVIPGTSSLRHLAENVATGQVHLDVDTLAVLDGLGAPPH